MEYDDRIEIRISKVAKEKLKKAAKKSRRKPSELARIFIEDALDKIK